MKRIVLIIFGVMLASIGALAQAPDDAITTALLGLPANLRDAAMVIKWKPDFTYDTLKQGTNHMVCYNRSGFPEQAPFSIECTSVGNLDRVAQNLKAEALGDKNKTYAMLSAMEKDETRVKPEYGSVWYHFSGPDKEHAHSHITIAVPGATQETTGLPDKPTQSSGWIMNPGTSTAHIMIPGA